MARTHGRRPAWRPGDLGRGAGRGARRTQPWLDRPCGRGRRLDPYVQHEHGHEQADEHECRDAGPSAHEAPPVARAVSRSAETLMPSFRKADATRARSSRPTSNCIPGSVRATIRTENV